MKYYTLQISRSLLREGQTAYPSNASGVASYARECCYGNDLWREQAFLVFLGPKNDIQGHFLLAMGGFDAVAIDKRLACVAMLGSGAPKGVLVHNHPSGDPVPSPRDINLTADVRKAFSAIGCQLVDHVILADETFFSFADEKVSRYSRK